MILIIKILFIENLIFPIDKMNSSMNKSTLKNPLDTTKMSTMPKSFISMSQINKSYRREQNYKKKLKQLVQSNSIVQSKIKIHEASIKDERNLIIFQLNELSKTMNSKISTYVDEKLDKDKFIDNQMAKETIKQMITKYEDVQKETKVTKRVYQNLFTIHQRYQLYSEEIDKLLKMTEKSIKQYDEGMDNMLQQKQNLIFAKRQQNQKILEHTQTATKKIDQYEEGKIKLIEEEAELKKYIDQLIKAEDQAKKQVLRFQQWSQIVIDKNHRKIFTKQNKQKQIELNILTQTNNNIQIYLNEVKNQQQKLTKMLQQKQNKAKQVKSSKKNKSMNKSTRLANNYINKM